MHYLREVHNCKHFRNPDFNRESAEAELVSRDGTPLSVYQVPDIATADRVIIIYAMRMKQQPEKIDYILLPEALLRKFNLSTRQDPGDIRHPLLQRTHHEILGLNVNVLEKLVDDLPSWGIQGRRVPKSELRDKAQEECNHSDGGPEALALVAGRPGWDYLQQPPRQP
jgi:hypothetical protein